MSDPAGQRRAELALGLAEVEQRLAAACAAAGRSRGEVRLVAVTKTWPVEDVRALYDLGLRDFGENRDQEAGPKAEALAQALGPGDEPARWHFVGQLQRNKAARVARYAAVVHSVDRAPLAQALSRGAVAAQRDVDVLLQVRLDEPPDDATRGGALPQQVPALADEVAGLPGLRLRGLMAVAPLGEDPQAAFTRLAALSARLRADHPGAAEVSAGMSGDLEPAVACGATIVRVGTALLGRRPPPLR